MELPVAEVWQTMGLAARAVMMLLAGMSVACLAIAGERVLALRRARGDAGRFLAAWRGALGQGGYQAASAHAGKYPRSALAGLVAEGTAVLDTADPRARLDAYDRTTRRLIRAATTDARRGLGVLATVGSTAPFVGLFGTVVGIINAFHHLSAGGQSGLGAVSAGIAEALVATALGIAVALPAVWLFNYLSQAIARFVVEMQNAAEELAVAALRREERRSDVA